MNLKAILLTGTLVTAGLVADAGFIHVKVHEKRENGTHLNLYVPAILATTAPFAIPERKLDRIAEKAREVLPALIVAAREMEKIPDGTLVEVQSTREHVRVTKEDGCIVVDVNDRRDEVHVAVPLHAIQSIAQNLQARVARLPAASERPAD